MKYFIKQNLHMKMAEAYMNHKLLKIILVMLLLCKKMSKNRIVHQYLELSVYFLANKPNRILRAKQTQKTIQVEVLQVCLPTLLDSQ